MGYFEVVLLGMALAMDAFSIALSKGLATKKLKIKDAISLGITFGLFQFAMPLLGWFISSRFSAVIKYSNYIGFALLVFIGGKMLYEGFKKDNETVLDTISFKSLIVLGIATSIDALAIGVTFSAFDFISVIIYCIIIGIITLVISFIGYFIGGKIGEKIGDKGELIGGAVLIILGIKMLIETF